MTKTFLKIIGAFLFSAGLTGIIMLLKTYLSKLLFLRKIPVQALAKIRRDLENPSLQEGFVHRYKLDEWTWVGVQDGSFPKNAEIAVLKPSQIKFKMWKKILFHNQSTVFLASKDKDLIRKVLRQKTGKDISDLL